MVAKIKNKKYYRTFCEKHNLLLFILFGSRAKNSQKKDSDYDFAFYTKKPISANKEITLFEDLMEIVKNEKIDLVNINTNHSSIVRKEIFMNGIPLFEKKKGLFENFKWASWIDYIDFSIFEDRRVALLKKQLEASVNA
ncbi:MAG: nucleotidyltransferase domain-containing protein [Nanoarchaeota archaeon]|nr:nucleotidyltransferase domain-containing protein [Nanoarchaeota archaeon]